MGILFMGNFLTEPAIEHIGYIAMLFASTFDEKRPSGSASIQSGLPPS
jgi:hypothetical protein